MIQKEERRTAMTFYQWIRKCLLWDEKRNVLPEKNKANLRKKVMNAHAKPSTEIDGHTESTAQ